MKLRLFITYLTTICLALFLSTAMAHKSGKSGKSHKSDKHSMKSCKSGKSHKSHKSRKSGRSGKRGKSGCDGSDSETGGCTAARTDLLYFIRDDIEIAFGDLLDNDVVRLELLGIACGTPGSDPESIDPFSDPVPDFISIEDELGTNSCPEARGGGLIFASETPENSGIFEVLIGYDCEED